MAYGRASREAMDSEQVGAGGVFWRPQDGDNTIRIMPPWSEDTEGRFWTRAGVHFNVGPDDRAIPCPEIGGASDSCWLCRRAKKLKKGDNDEQDEADAIEARPSYLMNVVDLDHPEEGVQVWRCGVKAFRSLRKLMRSDDAGDMTDFEDGYDIHITKTGSSIKTQYDVDAARKNTRFPSDRLLNHKSSAVAAIYQELDNQEYELTNLDDLQMFLTDEEMEAVYYGRSSGTTRTETKENRRGRRDEGEDEEEETKDEDEKPPRRGRRGRQETKDDEKGADEEETPPRRSRRRSRDDDDGEQEEGDKEENSTDRPSSRLRGRTRSLD